MKDKNYLFYLILFLLFSVICLFIFYYKEKAKPPEIEALECFLFFREGETLFDGPLYIEENFNVNLEAVVKAKKGEDIIYFSNYKNIILKKFDFSKEKIENFEQFPYILKFLWFTYEPEKIYYYIPENSIEDFKWKTFFIKDTNIPSFSPPLQAQNTSFLEKAPFGEFLGKKYGTMRYSVRVEIYDKRAPRVPFKVLHSSSLEDPDSALMVVCGKGEMGTPLYHFTSYGNLPYFSIPAGNLQFFKDTINKLLIKRWAFGTLPFCQLEKFKLNYQSVIWDGKLLLNLLGKPLLWGKDVDEGDSMLSQNQIVIFFEKAKGKITPDTKILSHTKTPLVLGNLKDVLPSDFILIHYIKQ